MIRCFRARNISSSSRDIFFKKKEKINREEEAKDEEWKDDKISGVFLDLSHLTGCPLGQVVQLLK